MSNPYLPLSPSSSSTPSFQNTSNPYALTPSAKHDPNGPITRSRTLFYLSIRDSSTTYSTRQRKVGRQYGDTIDVGEDEEQIGLMGGAGVSGSGSGHFGEEKGLPPKWVDVSDEVEEILSRAKLKITSLDKLHAKHVLPGFTDRSAEEREIERQTADITRDFRRCTSLISSVQPGPIAQRVEIVTAKNVQRGLAQKVQDLSGQFRKKQRVYMQKLQGHAIKNKDLMVASGAMTLKGSDMLDELQEDEQASKSQLQSQTQSQGVVAVDIDIQQRSNEITQIASSISELADLFRDLGNMIVEQGTVLDSVEYNVQQTARELNGAVEELKVAQRYQTNTGRRKCILFLVLSIVGLIIILIYKPRGSSSDITPIPIPSSPSSPAYDDYPVVPDPDSDGVTPSYKPILGQPTTTFQYDNGETVTVTATETPVDETPIYRPHRPMPKPPPLEELPDADW
ncbi:syntaxin 16 [Kwoniella heveanensis BCC8398]|uniref:Syntaxin 16 n=1 Tax=Kwoniella heveanensis BCC8398 TaxID=1296120 RepID=A0A1B9GTI5_9TREE|nr:syntaxin 16 [Kwoniella heveanensis BCC8398]